MLRGDPYRDKSVGNGEEKRHNLSYRCDRYIKQLTFMFLQSTIPLKVLLLDFMSETALMAVTWATITFRKLLDMDIIINTLSNLHPST